MQARISTHKNTSLLKLQNKSVTTPGMKTTSVENILNRCRHYIPLGTGLLFAENRTLLPGHGLAGVYKLQQDLIYSTKNQVNCGKLCF